VRLIESRHGPQHMAAYSVGSMPARVWPQPAIDRSFNTDSLVCAILVTDMRIVRALDQSPMSRCYTTCDPECNVDAAEGGKSSIGVLRDYLVVG